jgi:hypothetical protein
MIMKIFFPMAALVVVFFTSCHKSSSPASTTTKSCKLISATANNQGMITNFSFSYDEKDRLISVQSSGGYGTPYKETLDYVNNYIATYTDFSGTPGNRDTVFLDGSGNVSSISIWGTSNNKSTITYTRDSKGEPTQSTSVYSNGTTSTTTYQYTNGDLTSGASGGSPFSYSYYTDKPSAINDAQMIATDANTGKAISTTQFVYDCK